MCQGFIDVVFTSLVAAKVRGVKAGETKLFDTDFSHVKVRQPKGATFLLSVELRD